MGKEAGRCAACGGACEGPRGKAGLEFSRGNRRTSSAIRWLLELEGGSRRLGLAVQCFLVGPGVSRRGKEMLRSACKHGRVDRGAEKCPSVLSDASYPCSPQILIHV
jgi:hypothetical protein